MSDELTTQPWQHSKHSIVNVQFASVAAKIYSTVDLGVLSDPLPMEDVKRLTDTSQITVDSDLAYTRAAERWKEIKAAKKSLDSWAKPHKDKLNTAKDELMSFIKRFSAPLDEADKVIDSRMKEYKRQRAAAAEAALEAARSAAAPWEESPAPVAMVALPAVAGVSERQSPMKAKVADKRLALETALKEGNEWMLNFIEFDMPGLNTLARREGDLLKNTWPGIEAFRETSTVNR